MAGHACRAMCVAGYTRCEMLMSRGLAACSDGSESLILGHYLLVRFAQCRSLKLRAVGLS